MKTEWIIALLIGVTGGLILGFALGYLVRSAISRRRRQWVDVGYRRRKEGNGLIPEPMTSQLFRPNDPYKQREARNQLPSASDAPALHGADRPVDRD
jgi:hypothetical protein